MIGCYKGRGGVRDGRLRRKGKKTESCRGRRIETETGKGQKGVRIRVSGLHDER